jgi:uncharacterized protein YodC (DUF2158 family)
LKDKYKTGDIVQLKSSGPKMTVVRYLRSHIPGLDADEDSGVKVRCQWFAGAKLESGDFLEDSLQPAPVEKK